MEFISKFIQAMAGEILPPLLIFAVLFVLWQRKRISRAITRKRIINGIGNLVLFGMNTVLITLFFAWVTEFSKFVYQRGLPHIPENFWDQVPLPVTFAIILIVLDFGNYVSHRISHTKYFWGIHVLHHSDTEMTWTTTYRVHILQFLQMKLVFIFVFGWMFFPVELVALVAAVRVFYSQYIHTQFGFTHGRFSKILASPNYHRWHHADVPAAYGKNLCDMFPIWDIMFGTYYDPGICKAKLGVKGAPEDIILAQTYPFKHWAGMLHKPKQSRPLEN